jgi:5-formyltetrahydrofolate cyclo-ligase
MAKAARLGRAPPLLVALAYSVQLRHAVPMDPRDMPVDILVTADGLIRRGPA